MSAAPTDAFLNNTAAIYSTITGGRITNPFEDPQKIVDAVHAHAQDFIDASFAAAARRLARAIDGLDQSATLSDTQKNELLSAFLVVPIADAIADDPEGEDA